MEVPELTCPASPARDQPAPAPGPPGAPGGQASPRLTLGPVILPPEQGLAPTVFLKALPIPLYHTVPPGGLQPRAPLVTGSLDGGNVPFILSPLLQPEGLGPTQMGKPVAPTLTVNIVGALPVLSPGLGPTLGSPGKVRNAGKYLCPHCGRDCLKPSVLEKHIRSHTGERPFPCATCGIAFKTQSNLYKHRRTQTHLNNSRLSSESDGGGGSHLEEGDKAGETSRADGRGDSWSQRVRDAAQSERPLSPGAQRAGHCPLPTTRLFPVAKNLELKLEAIPCPGSTFTDREAPLDSTHTASAGLPVAGTQPRRKLLEQKSPTASRSCFVQQQQQQAMSAEKPWDPKASEGRLRKCESTDSGYLSRSDSVEQPLAPSSPLHSLSEHSAESEGEGAPGPGGARAEPGEQGPSLELEKKQLEERIARLISHNQAVVDDSQLDNVRPRKTVLSKQGSIDLPMPYTYKDSFHFDLRALEPGRRRQAALCSARSTFTPLDKTRPLFFHSVPTQLSTTVECVPVTRSNSLPFVEGTRMWQEPLDPQDTCPRGQKPLSPRPTPARLVGVPSGHPRALVRQAAVEDLPCPPTGDTPAPAEAPDGKRTAVGERGAGQARATSRKGSQRKLKMFSQEKWQVYGSETFKRIYQKMRASHHGSRKAKEETVGSGTGLDHPLQAEAAGCKGAAPAQDERTPVLGDISVGAKPGPWGSLPAPEGFLVTEPQKQRETVARAGGSDQPGVNRATSPPTLSCTEPPCLGSKSPQIPPKGRLELGCQLSPAPGPLKESDLQAPRLASPDPKLEGGTCNGRGTKTCQRAQTVLRQPSSNSGEPQALEDKLPSERKKLKVEELSCQEQSECSGAEGEAPGSPMQAASPSSQNQDSGPGNKLGGLHGSSDCMARGSAGQQGKPLETSSASSAASSVALWQAGPRAEGPSLCPAAAATMSPSQPAVQPRPPGALAAPADAAFPPKYLLRLPQGETHPSPLDARGPAQGQAPLCGRRCPEERASFVESGLGALLPPSAVSGLAPGGEDSFEEDPCRSRPGDWRKGVQGDEKGDLDTSTPAAGESPGLAAGAPRETASFLPTPVCDSPRSATRDTHHLCMGSTLARARPSGGVLNPWAPNRELRAPPKSAPEDPPSGSLAGPSACCSLWPSSFLSAPMPSGWPELALCPHSETPGSSRARGPFPTLRAEPLLVWCCLSRSLPLPMEQKEKAASVYLALHSPGGSPRDEGPDAQPGRKAVSGGWPRTSPGEGGQAQTLKLSHPLAPGMASQDPVTEQEWKKGLRRRRVKMSRGSSKQKKLSLNSKRYKGNFSQSRVQLRAGRLRKPLWVPRKDCPPPPLKGLGPRRALQQASSETAGVNLQGEPSYAVSELSLRCGNGEEEEDGGGQISGSFSPDISSRTAEETEETTVKAISPSAGEHGDCCPQNTAVGSGLSVQSDSRMAVANDSLLSCGKGLDMGLLELQLLPSQEQVSVDPKLCVFLDAQEPSSLESKGTSPRHDVATSVAATCTSVGARAGDTTLGIHSAEPQDYSQAAGETLTQSSPDRKARAEGISPSLLPGKSSSGQRISGSVPLGSTGKTHLEIPASGPDSTSSPQEEGRHKTSFPSRGQYECGEMVVSCPPIGKDSGKCQVSGLITLKDCVVPFNPGQPTEFPEAPLKTIRKRSLEGMRKQTRVEFSDTSSDDEDRLVIEI
ncbi:zinc finger protein 831 [Equus przewalskii]|uniref:Zinc finger protein 831 n=1 Tax=Equus przewalskii TaxID=9798 RepID=A0ABM4LZ70_EQUPR